MRYYWKKEWTTPAAVGVVSFAAGVAAGAFGYRWRLDRQINRDMVEISEAMRESVETFPTRLVFEEIPPSKISPNISEFTGVTTIKDLPVGDHRGMDTPMSLGEAIDRAPLDESLDHEEPEDEPPAKHNIFEDDNWDVAEELANRSPDAPYVIHKNEWDNQDGGQPQQELRWFTEDKILCDENNLPIYNPEQVVGQLPWGYGSLEEDVVYIRNEARRGEYMITRVEGSYQIMVLGLDAEEKAEEQDLRHSAEVRRFRLDRD